MRARDRAYRFGRASGTPADHDRFRALRADTSNALDCAKNRYVASLLADALSANAKWLELRRLWVTKPSLPCLLDRFSAQALNAHYAATVSRHPPATEHDFEAIIHQHQPSINTLFCLRPFSSREVTEALQRASSKSTGHDGLSVPMLKLIAPHSLTPITNQLNTSFSTATTFPANWKRAIIKPLAKTKAMTQPSDTRPIVQLPGLSEVLERLVHNHLQGYLEANHLLHHRRFPPCAQHTDSSSWSLRRHPSRH